MKPRTPVADDHLVRLHALTARLTARIGEGEDARVRLTRAMVASGWSDVRLALRHGRLPTRARN